MTYDEIVEAFRQPYRLEMRDCAGVPVPYRVIADDVAFPNWPDLTDKQCAAMWKASAARAARRSR